MSLMFLPSPLAVFVVIVVISVAAELVTGWLIPSKLRQYLASGAIITAAFGAGILMLGYPGLPALGFLFVTIYRILNLLRIVEDRIAEPHLSTRVKRSSIVLLMAGGLVLLLLYFSKQTDASQFIAPLLSLWAFAAVLASLAAALTVHYHLRMASKSTPPIKITKSVAQPTVSVLIPARNETTELPECLRSVLASDYPKLEVLVLDDCSQDKTSLIIKEFAHDGVRFIAGKPTPEAWVAKNWAYKQLCDEASGEVLFFIGVDVALSKSSISSLVNLLQSLDYQMLSVFPRRLGQKWLGVVVQPMRYWLELAIPSFVKRHPPVLSTCWIITAKAYKKVGELDAVRRAIIPETYFARRLSETKKYRPLISRPDWEIGTRKSMADQINTALRTRYPQTGRQVERVGVLSALALLLLLGPYAVLIAGIFIEVPVYLLTGMFLSVLLYTYSNWRISLATNPDTWPLSLINFPIISLVEIGLLNLSLYKYEFSEVLWKGRNICLPIMRVVPQLPPLNDKPNLN